MRIAALIVVLAAPALAQEAQTRPVPELYCTDRNGDRVELGGLTCIAASCQPPYLARCEMSLNNVIWRKLQDGCPAVAAEPPGSRKSDG